MRGCVFALLAILALGLVGLALLGAWPGVRESVLATGRLLGSSDLTGVREHLRSYGPWAPVATFVLIQFQAVFAPLPSFPVIYAAAVCPWPGMPADRIEQLVTRKIEERIAENARVVRIESTTRGSVAIVGLRPGRGKDSIDHLRHRPWPAHRRAI
jgi:hypothetical protein